MSLIDSHSVIFQQRRGRARPFLLFLCCPARQPPTPALTVGWKQATVPSYSAKGSRPGRPALQNQVLRQRQPHWPRDKGLARFLSPAVTVTRAGSRHGGRSVVRFARREVALRLSRLPIRCPGALLVPRRLGGSRLEPCPPCPARVLLLT